MVGEARTSIWPAEPVARRSCLSVPGNSTKMLGKAAELEPDEVVIDLEDSVPADQKDAARAQVCEALREGSWRAASIAVRINALETRWSYRDIVDLVGRAGDRLGSLVIPKVESGGDVEFVARLAGLVEQETGRARPVGLQLLVETATGLCQLEASAAASSRVEALIIGYADLSASLGLAPAGGARPGCGDWTPIRLAVLVAARAAGVAAVDGPYFQVRDLDGLVDDTRRAVRQGFDGKWAIHPSQIDVLNESFLPADDELEWAAAVIEEIDRGGEGRRGAVLFRGEMIDEAMRKQATRVLTRGRFAQSKR